MALYLGNTAIGNGNYLGNLNIRDSNIFMSQSVAPEPVSLIQRLAVSSSLFAYYDIAFTASYSGSGQTTVFDLSGNNRTGSVIGTLGYKSISSGSSVTTASFGLMQGGNNDTNQVAMPQVTLSGNYTFVCSWYGKNILYSSNYTEIFVGRDPDAYGILSQNAANSFRVIASNNDNLSTTQFPINTATTESWHVTQYSFNDSTNNVNYCADGQTGSFTLTSAISTGTITPKWNNGGTGTGFDPYLGSGSMVQVMALYTGSLTTSELLQNHDSIKGRYGLA
jgi:hypothetical protein